MATDKGLTGSERVRKLQTMLHAKAKEDSKRRFHALCDKVWREDLLQEAWEQVRRNGGSAGVDGEGFKDIEAYGVGRWLGELARDLREGTYVPKPVRQVLIPKKQPGKYRPLGIPCIRDRVAQTAALLVLEPIFEADGPADHGGAEAAGQRAEDPMPAVSRGTAGVSGLPHRTQLSPQGEGSLHRHSTQQGERSRHLPQDQRVDGAEEREAAARRDGRTPEPDHDRVGELLLPGAGQPGLPSDRPPRDPAAAAVALSEAQGEVRGVCALLGRETMEDLWSHLPGVEDEGSSLGEGMISTESRMLENGTSGLTSGGEETRLGRD